MKKGLKARTSYHESQETEKRFLELFALNRLIKELNFNLSEKDFFSFIYDRMYSILDPDFVVLYLIENSELVLKGDPHKNSLIEHATEKYHKIKDCLCGIVAQTGESVFSENIHTDPRCTLLECKNAGIRSFAGLPLLVNDTLIGILGIASITHRRFSDSAAFLESIAGSVAVWIHNDQLYEKLLKSQSQLKHELAKREKVEKEKRQAQTQALEQANQAFVGRVAGKMAHDFNNVLSIIMGNAELGLMECEEGEIKEILELIFEQTLRGKNLTKNLVAFAKDQEPKQEFFRISDKIDLGLNLFKKDLEGIELIREEKTDLPELLADPGMIEHALVNLVQNAIHATSIVEQPKIMIRTYDQDKTLCIEIEDNGCGIPEEHKKNIYAPAFTLKGSKDRTGSYKPGIRGTGYGLANVKKYINQHKGNISLESTVSLGTKFKISLPIIKKELTHREKTQIQKEISYFSKHILVVEDETAISEIQYRVLTQDPCHHTVDIAPKGQIAIDLFDRNDYDLVILDYILPGNINGMDIYNHIRKTHKTLPILFISGNIEFLESINELKQNDGYLDHLSKPCQNKTYVKAINALFLKTKTPAP